MDICRRSRIIEKAFIKNSTIKADRLLSFFLCLYLIFNEFNIVARELMDSSVFSAIKVGMIILLACFLAAGLLFSGRKSFLALGLAELIVLILFLYGEIVGASFNDYKSVLYEAVLINVPLMITAFLIKDKKVLLKMLVAVSWIIFGLCLIELIILKNSVTYSMHFSYALILPLLIHFYYLINKKRLLYVFIIAIEIIMMLVFGSRGALLCVFPFVLIATLYKCKNRFSRFLLVIFFFFLFLVLIYTIFPLIGSFINNLGITGRTVTLLSEGSFLKYDSGRLEIWLLSIELIKQKPLFGWGIYGASTYLSSINGAMYPHQLFLDCFLCFGFVFGSLFLIILFYVFSKAFLRIRFFDESTRILLAIFFSIAITTLMYSSTLFSYFYFFILMGLSLGICRGKICVD